MIIKNANIVDVNGIIQKDILIQDGKIAKVEKNIVLDNEEILDAKGFTVMPAFIDLHAHFRDPGFTYKEDLYTGCKSAAKGGYTYVNLMANTNPICSTAEMAKEIMDRAKKDDICDVHQIVAITKNFDGENIEHLSNLPSYIKAVSDDGKGVTSNDVMARALKLSAEKGFIVMSHAEDMVISKYDYRLAENLETARNVLLASYYNAKLHMAHVSTKESLQYIIQAKQNCKGITCEVEPHHIYFSDNDYKVNPPIRKEYDRLFLIDSIKNGLVDCIATDHAPHTKEEKENGAPGMVGLETSFAVCNKVLVKEYGLPLTKLSALFSYNPAKIMGLNKGEVKVGFDADLVIVDTERLWTVDINNFASKSNNTMFEGEELQGEILTTIKAGKITYKKG